MKPIQKIIASTVKSNSAKLFLILLLMFMIVGFDVISPWPFKILIDNVLAANTLDLGNNLAFLNKIVGSRYLLGFLVVLVYFFSTFALTLVEYIHSVFTKTVIKNLTGEFSKKAFQSLQSLAIGFYNKQQIGDYIYRLSFDVSALGDFLEAGVLPVLTSGLYLLITTVIMFLINWQLTLLSLVILPILTSGLYIFNSSIEPATKRSEFYNSAAFSFIEEALTHLKIIQAFSQERRESRMFNHKIETSLKNDSTVYKLDFMLSLLVGIVIAISYSIIILYGIQLVFVGTITTGLLIVFIFYLDNLTNPILSLIYAATTIKQSYVKVMRMNDFFSAKTHLKLIGKIKHFQNTAIKFDHVTLRGSKGAKILDNVSILLEANKRTVIFGVNGSGKSSIVNLIMRFIDKPSSGTITIGKVNLEDYDLKILRDNIAFVPQEITLFNDSIRNNIAFGNPNCTLRDIQRGAELAAADDFIRKLPGGYNFQVGEGGNFLSGGQRQRLMLARALLKSEAKILLFDETLSALDVKTRKQVMKNIYQFSKSKTTIIVSNIFDVIKEADNVVVLYKGKVIYSGSSARLPAELSLYKMIVDYA